MTGQANPTAPGPAGPGLPPVQPPTGQMIFRLFLVPFVIVAVLVGLYLLAHAFYGRIGRTRSAERYLQNLDSANPDIRWRAASDLSQELPRSPELAANATFALALAERLQAALDDSAEQEKEFASRHNSLSDSEKERRLSKDLAPTRNLIIYLGSCLGNFSVPVGVPLLARLATQTDGMEPIALAERRGRALFALAALGNNLERYDQLDEEDKNRIDSELAGCRPGQERWARPTREYLQKRREGQADSFGVIEVLRQCGEDEDPYLRELTALASNFWKGTTQEEKTLDELLARLAVDAGEGEDRLEERQARNPDNRRSWPITRRRGFKVQANANLALARRGSSRVRLDLLAEMLDPRVLGEIFIVRSRSDARGEAGRDRPDDALVAVTVSGTLRAVAELRRQRPDMNLSNLHQQVEALTQHDNAALRGEAQRTLAAFAPR